MNEWLIIVSFFASSCTTFISLFLHLPNSSPLCFCRLALGPSRTSPPPRSPSRKNWRRACRWWGDFSAMCRVKGDPCLTPSLLFSRSLSCFQFELFYNQNFSGRKLTWLHYLCTGTNQSTFFCCCSSGTEPVEAKSSDCVKWFPRLLRRSEDELPGQALRGDGDHLPDGRAAGLQQQPDCVLQGAAGRHTDEREGAAEDHQVPAGRQDAQPRLAEGQFMLHWTVVHHNELRSQLVHSLEFLCISLVQR